MMNVDGSDTTMTLIWWYDMNIGILALCFAVLASPFFILGMKDSKERKVDVKPTEYHGYYSIKEL